MTYLYLFACGLLAIGFGFDFAYHNRRKKAVDKKCNDYFVIAQSCKIVTITILFVYLVLLLFNLF